MPTAGRPHFLPSPVSGTLERQSGIPCRPKSVGEIDPLPVLVVYAKRPFLVTTIQHAAVSVVPNGRVPLGDWGYLVTLEQGTDTSSGAGGAQGFHGFVTALAIHLTAPHGALPAGSEIQVGYAIGMAKPVSVKVDTFHTGDERAAAEFVMNAFDFRPRAIIERLDLLRPIYRGTTNYGHFGRTGLPWEVVEKAAAVAK